MSASERLRALDAGMTPGPWAYAGSAIQRGPLREHPHDPAKPWLTNVDGGVASLRNALPLIRDVVEAAERVSEQIGAMGSTEKGEAALVAAGIESNQLAWHLAALREHLEGES